MLAFLIRQNRPLDIVWVCPSRLETFQPKYLFIYLFIYFPLFNQVSPIEMIIYFTREHWPRDQQYSQVTSVVLLYN